LKLDDVKSRLSGSDSVASLRAEQEVVAAFKQLEWWSVEHGPFFRDGATGKLRELDVRASRSWSGGEFASAYANANLEVLVEVKSLRGYHIVFAPEPNGCKVSRAQRAWFGDCKDRLGGFLTNAGVSSALAGQMVTRFEELAYPKGTMTVHKLVVDPPKAPVFATAFRETNIGAEKDLDSSVLWKAIQGLNSVVESSRERSKAHLLSHIKGQIDLALLDGHDLASVIERELANAVRRVTMFHPTVVLDARLWVSRGRELEEIDHARFSVQEPEKWPARWLDVVTRKSFSQWIDQLTTHYSSRLEHPDEPIWRENARSFGMLLEVLRDPSLEIDLKVKKGNSHEPGKRILMRAVRRRRKKGATPIAVEDRDR
jgi:hypothetical protein